MRLFISVIFWAELLSIITSLFTISITAKGTHGHETAMVTICIATALAFWAGVLLWG